MNGPGRTSQRANHETPATEASVALSRTGRGTDVLWQRTSNAGPFAFIKQAMTYLAVGSLLILLVPELPLIFQLLLLALVLLTLKRWGASLVLVIVQIDLYFREGRDFAPLSGIIGAFFAIVVVGVLMVAARNRLLLQSLARVSFLNQARAFLASMRSSGAGDTSQAAQRHLRQALRLVVMLIGLVSFATIVLALLPSSRELHVRLRGVATTDPAMRTAATVTVLILALWFVLATLAWRRLSPDQAKLSLRSDLLQTSLSDLRMIVRRRIKERRRKATKAKTTPTPTAISDQ